LKTQQKNNKTKPNSEPTQHHEYNIITIVILSPQPWIEFKKTIQNKKSLSPIWVGNDNLDVVIVVDNLDVWIVENLDDCVLGSLVFTAQGEQCSIFCLGGIRNNSSSNAGKTSTIKTLVLGEK